jgi:hypothetical protein
MAHRMILFAMPALLTVATSGCGLYTPQMDALAPDHVINSTTGLTSGTEFLNTLARHVKCEIASGIWLATQNPHVHAPWLKDHHFGTSVTLITTAEDQSNLSPGVSAITPFQNKVYPYSAANGGNVTISQSFSLGVGFNGSANATRTQTTQFTVTNDDLYQLGATISGSDGKPHCEEYTKGITIDSDLEINNFVYDYAFNAGIGDFSNASNLFFPYNAMTYDTTFTVSFGGNVTPAWKLARISNNPSSSLFAATRTNTDEVIVTMGNIATYASAKGPNTLSASASNQHNARVQGSSTATGISSQSH